MGCSYDSNMVSNHVRLLRWSLSCRSLLCTAACCASERECCRPAHVQAVQQEAFRMGAERACEPPVASTCIRGQRPSQQSADASLPVDARESRNPLLTGPNSTLGFNERARKLPWAPIHPLTSPSSGRGSSAGAGWKASRPLVFEQQGCELPWSCSSGSFRALHTSAVSSSGHRRTGLYAYEELTSPQGFRAMGEDARAR